jgi:hypothetical protein
LVVLGTPTATAPGSASFPVIKEESVAGTVGPFGLFFSSSSFALILAAFLLSASTDLCSSKTEIQNVNRVSLGVWIIHCKAWNSPGLIKLFVDYSRQVDYNSQGG